MNPSRAMRIWKTPFIIAVLTTFGLLSALLGTGVWHWLSWVTLVVPAIIAIKYILRAPGK